MIKKVLISTFFYTCLNLSTSFAANNIEQYTTDSSCPDTMGVGINAQEGFVHHITDGDTLVLQNEQRVRLLGIDTPEVDFRHPEKSQPLGINARNSLKHMLPDGSRVYLIFDQRKRDRYKRLLAFVLYVVLSQISVYDSISTF